MKSHPLKVARESHHWSQAKLAKELGVSVRSVSRWEQGLAVPFPYYRRQLCTLFDKTAEELGLPSDIDENEILEEAPSPMAQPSEPDSPVEDEVDGLPAVGQGSSGYWQDRYYENVTAFANALQDASKDALSIPPTILLPQLPSSLSKTSPQPAKGLPQAAETSPEPAEALPQAAEMSTLPEAVRSTQPAQSPGDIWRIVLLVVAIVVVIASGARLWYIIASSSVSVHSTAPAIGKDNPTSLANVSTPVMATPTRATSGGTPSVSLPSPTPAPTPLASYEAESVLNTLADGATVLKCPRCSGREKVGYIGLNYNIKINGILQFNNIYKNSGGKYKLTIYYLLSGIDVPTGYMSVNGGPAVGFNVPSTANGKVVGTLTIMVSLNAGDNTIEFSNPSACAPDIDRIVV
jgi:transcriptional regulator with XRE-family HTH domain